MWFNKADKPDVSGEGKDSVKDMWYYLERDTMVTSRIKMGTGKDSLMKVVHYRVLGLYDKSYNKWWMTGEKKGWGPMLKDTEKKKYKVAMRLVEEGSYTEFDDVQLDDVRYKLDDICRIVHGTDIIGVIGTYKSMN